MIRKAFLTLFVLAFGVAVSGILAGEEPAETAATMTASNMSAAVGQAAPDFTLTDAAGKSHSLAAYKGKYVVLEWVNFDCPFVHRHYSSGNMPRLQKGWTEKGVVWLSICSSASGKQGHYDGKALTDRIKTEGFSATAYLVDGDGKVGRMYGAKTTPHMFVIDPKGMLIYSGAIDDKPTANLEETSTGTNYISAALDAAMAGKDIATKSTASYGCSVKY